MDYNIYILNFGGDTVYNIADKADSVQTLTEKLEKLPHDTLSYIYGYIQGTIDTVGAAQTEKEAS